MGFGRTKQTEPTRLAGRDGGAAAASRQKEEAARPRTEAGQEKNGRADVSNRRKPVCDQAKAAQQIASEDARPGQTSAASCEQLGSVNTTSLKINQLCFYEGKTDGFL